MLVDDKLAKEKLARICEEGGTWKTSGQVNQPATNWARAEGKYLAQRIRNTDLTDCQPMTVAQGTPRTDADAFWIYAGETRTQYQGNEYVRASVARKLEVELHTANEQCELLSAQVVELQKLYNELLYGVARKYPNETRHQTALRYINNAETVHYGVAQANVPPSVKDSGTPRTDAEIKAFNDWMFNPSTKKYNLDDRLITLCRELERENSEMLAQVSDLQEQIQSLERQMEWTHYHGEDL